MFSGLSALESLRSVVVKNLLPCNTLLKTCIKCPILSFMRCFLCCSGDTDQRPYQEWLRQQEGQVSDKHRDTHIGNRGRTYTSKRQTRNKLEIQTIERGMARGVRWRIQTWTHVWSNYSQGSADYSVPNVIPTHFRVCEAIWMQLTDTFLCLVWEITNELNLHK